MSDRFCPCGAVPDEDCGCPDVPEPQRVRIAIHEPTVGPATPLPPDYQEPDNGA
jgi:hypothetical protein